MITFDWAIDEDPAWGGGLQAPDPRFKFAVEVVITQTITGPSTTGEHVLVVQDEIGRVTREGHLRVLVRLERRAHARSVYLPVDVLQVWEKA